MNMLGLGALRESEVLDFHQRDGENMKKAWDRISEAHRIIMPWIPIRIVLSNFYRGLFKWCKHSLDIMAEGDFLECDEARALDILHSLSSYLFYDRSFDTVIDRLATIEKMMDALDLRKVEELKSNKKEMLEIDENWEPFVRISIDNLSYYHEHAN